MSMTAATVLLGLQNTSQKVFGVTFDQRGLGGKFCLREAPGPQVRAEALAGPDRNVFSLGAVRHV